MAEHVTNVSVTPGANRARLRDLLSRFPGDALEARGVTRRDSEALFLTLASARGRLPVTRVTRHVCRHDEGEGDCRSALIEG